MIELELLGPSADGQSVVFTDDNGNRYEVLIDDKLRSVVRRDLATHEPPPVTMRGKPRPADIQSLLRQGRSAHDVADLYGVDVEAIRRFESPVAAEKDWAVLQAQRAPVGTDPGAPRLEELVINRLATRGVDQTSLQWNAQKQPGKPWEVSVTFIQSAVERLATWQLIGDGKQLEALDQEAHWLTDSAAPSQSVRAIFEDVSVLGAPTDSAEDDQESEILLGQLNAKRGKRQPIMDFFEGEGDDVLADAVDSTSSLPYFSARMAAAPKTASTPQADTSSDKAPIPFPTLEARESKKKGSQDPPPAEEEEADAELTQPLFETTETPESKTAKKRKSGRPSVPSWDEIVFGTRSD